MNKEKIEELMVKWVDHRLTEAESVELDKMLLENPSLKDEIQKMVQVKNLIQTEVPASVEPPYPDFFNSQVMRKIDSKLASQQPKAVVRRWWQDLRVAWVPAGALALVLSFLAGQRLSEPSEQGSALVEANQIPSVYFSESHLEAEVISDSNGDVSAIVVEGLSELDDKGFFATTTAELPVSYQRYESSRLH